MTHKCQCPCPELHCADPSSRPRAKEEEQVMMVAELGLVAAALDGELGPAKADRLATALRLLPGMGGLSDSEINLIIARAAARSTDGRRWLCNTTNGIRSPALRRVAFRLASMFCAWRGELGTAAQEYLSAVATAFNFSDREAAELFSQATGWDPPAAADVAG